MSDQITATNPADDISSALAILTGPPVAGGTGPERGEDDPGTRASDESAQEPAELAQVAEAVTEEVEEPKPKVVEAKDKLKDAGRADKALRLREQKLREAEAKVTAFDRAEEMLKKGEVKKFLEIVGLPAEKVFEAEQRAKDPVGSRLDPIARELAELKAELARRDEAAKVELVKRDIKQTAAKDEDAYELVRLYDAYDDAYDLIDKHFQESGELLSNEDALSMIEDILLEQATVALKAKKVAGDVRGKAGAAAPVKAGDAKAKAPAPTLTNRSAAANADPKKSARDEWEAALATLNKG
jgi:hypothetical protein